MKTTKPKTHEAITIRVTLSEAEAIRKQGRADYVVLRMVRNALADARRVEGMVEALAELPPTAEEMLKPSAGPMVLVAPQPKPTQINASTADMAASGLSKDFIYWLGNNCHNSFVLQLYKALESYGRGIAA